jgi:hypothetical protein
MFVPIGCAQVGVAAIRLVNALHQAYLRRNVAEVFLAAG